MILLLLLLLRLLMWSHEASAFAQSVVRMHNFVLPVSDNLRTQAVIQSIDTHISPMPTHKQAVRHRSDCNLKYSYYSARVRIASQRIVHSTNVIAL